MSDTPEPPPSEAPRRGGLRDLPTAAFVTCFGLGNAPFAPGIFGTLGGVALAALAAFTWPELYLPLVIAAVVIVSLGCAAAGGWAERTYGRKDPGAFVADEVAGYLVAAAWVSAPGWNHLLAAFVLFRVFDIVKPPPAKRLEKLPKGWGIVVDDLVAGAYALVVLVVLRALFPELLAS